MRFALIDNKRVEATPKVKEGLCPACSKPVIAKCGKQRINHWAHRTNKMCDNWWESETEWHRSWKNNFPVDWQEVCLIDKQTGEKHIADIRSNHDVVIEFQHSHIDPKERVMREKFYKNMVWVVDGTRLKRDFSRFLKGKQDCFEPSAKSGCFFVNFPDECFPLNWIENSVPVIFDFRGNIPSSGQQDIYRELLWCLLPVRDKNQAVVMAISRSQFISIVPNNPHLFSNLINSADSINSF